VPCIFQLIVLFFAQHRPDFAAKLQPAYPISEKVPIHCSACDPFSAPFSVIATGPIFPIERRGKKGHPGHTAHPDEGPLLLVPRAHPSAQVSVRPSPPPPPSPRPGGPIRRGTGRRSRRCTPASATPAPPPTASTAALGPDQRPSPMESHSDGIPNSAAFRYEPNHMTVDFILFWRRFSLIFFHVLHVFKDLRLLRIRFWPIVFASILIKNENGPNTTIVLVSVRQLLDFSVTPRIGNTRAYMHSFPFTPSILIKM